MSNNENVFDVFTAVKTQRAPGELKVGDYVLATRWGDADWSDPWAVGFVSQCLKDTVRVAQEDGSEIPGVGLMEFKYAKLITAEQANKLVPLYNQNEGVRFDPDVVYTAVYATEPYTPLEVSKTELARTEFEQQLLNEPPQRDIFMDYAEKYHSLCDVYDATVCTGKDKLGEPVPSDGEEGRLVGAHARKLFDKFVDEICRKSPSQLGNNKGIVHNKLNQASTYVLFMRNANTKR